MLTTQFLLAACSLVTYAAADLPSLPNSAHDTDLRGSALIKRNWDGWQTFPEECKEKCKPYIDIRKNCGAPVDASLLEDESDKLACTCTTAYFDATVACVECAPEPFSEAIGDSAREWLESALDICIDTGKEMECVDASSLSTEVPQEGSPDDDAKNEDVTGDAHQSKGKSSESEKSTSSVAPSSTEGSTDSITSSASSTITIGGENSTMSNGSARETPLPASEDEESNTVEMPFGSASSLVFDIQFLFLQAVLASFSLFMICLR